jgi:hypothetical protein
MRQSLYGNQIIMWSFCIQHFIKSSPKEIPTLFFMLYALCFNLYSLLSNLYSISIKKGPHNRGPFLC